MGVEKDTTMRDESPDPTKAQSEPAGANTYRNVAELAADLNLSERSTRDALRRGEIPHIRIGRRFILPRAAIAEWLRAAGGASAALPAGAADVTSTQVAGGPRTEVTVMRRAAGRP